MTIAAKVKLGVFLTGLFFLLGGVADQLRGRPIQVPQLAVVSALVGALFAWGAEDVLSGFRYAWRQSWGVLARRALAGLALGAAAGALGVAALRLAGGRPGYA